MVNCKKNNNKNKNDKGSHDVHYEFSYNRDYDARSNIRKLYNPIDDYNAIDDSDADNEDDEDNVVIHSNR